MSLSPAKESSNFINLCIELWLVLPFAQSICKGHLDSYTLPLCSSGQSSWLQIQRSRVRFPALSDFLRSSGSGSGSTQPHEDNRSYLNGKVAAMGLENRDYGCGDTLRWPSDTVYQLKLVLTSPTGCGRPVGIVRLRTKTTDFLYSIYKLIQNYCRGFRL
jgi:hypothetical protein